MNSYSMGFGSIYMFATWVLVGFSTYALVKLFIIKKKGNFKVDSDIEILKKRYARGEINADEYRKIKRELSEDYKV